jgi:predicted nucleotidyltransferase component of viral defense system
MVSHVLAAITACADDIIFYGGTALSRTVLPDLRLSEDIDLLSVSGRKPVATRLDQAISDYMRPRFGTVEARPWLADTRHDTDPSVFRIAGINIQIQLVDGRDYPAWPTVHREVEQRYAGIPSATFRTYTAAAFVGAKTVAWAETTRNAPRDLYDLWALARAGHINAEAAELFKRYGPTGAYPERWLFPRQAPTEQHWKDALAHQCRLRVTAAEAYGTVVQEWGVALADLSH